MDQKVFSFFQILIIHQWNYLAVALNKWNIFLLKKNFRLLYITIILSNLNIVYYVMNSCISCYITFIYYRTIISPYRTNVLCKHVGNNKICNVFPVYGEYLPFSGSWKVLIINNVNSTISSRISYSRLL